MTEIPVRETFWNIPAWAVAGVYVGGAIAVAVFAWGLYRRIRVWRRGGPEMRGDRIPERIVKVIREVLFQARILSQPYPGIMHAAMFWGFLALFTGTAIATVDWEVTRLLFDFRVLEGPFYLLFELTLDLFGLFLLVGLGLALWRRFVKRPKRIEPSGKFAYALLVLFVLALTGFLIEGARLAVTQPPWGPWSPVGWGVGQALLAAGMGEGALRGLHFSLWLAHALIVFGFIALIPRSYFVHLVATPLNIFFSRLPPRGALAKIENLEEQETFGISKFEQFSWKRRLDFDACVECGRCHDICCAQQTGGVLSPKRVMVKLKRYMLDGDTRPLHGDVISPEELWSCTTCAACARECPAHLDIVDTIVDLRRYLALSEGALPSTAPRYLMGLGRPEDLMAGVALGVDLFDCVVPTRHARHGMLFTSQGVLAIRNARFAGDGAPPDPACDCPTCRHHERGYLRHLFQVGDALGPRLATLHNLRFYLGLMERARHAISAGGFAALREQVERSARARVA